MNVGTVLAVQSSGRGRSLVHCWFGAPLQKNVGLACYCVSVNPTLGMNNQKCCCFLLHVFEIFKNAHAPSVKFLLSCVCTDRSHTHTHARTHAHVHTHTHTHTHIHPPHTHIHTHTHPLTIPPPPSPHPPPLPRQAACCCDVRVMDSPGALCMNRDNDRSL